MNNSVKEVGILHPNALIFKRPLEDGVSNVLCHTGRVTYRSDGWTNSFFPLLLCELGSNHSVRQGGHERCVEGIQTGGLITLSVIHLSGIYLADLSDVVKRIGRAVG